MDFENSFDTDAIFADLEALDETTLTIFDQSEDDDELDWDFPSDLEREDSAEPQRCQPVPYKHKITKKIIATVDSETDPFAPGLIVKPFAIGFDMGDRYVEFWGDDCVEQFFAFLATLSAEGYEFIIYAHNGGKFDFFFFLKYLDKGQSPLIMGGRLVKIYFQGQEFRDSFAIIPQALSAYKKDDIDYRKFTRDRRERHKAEILKYMRGDCIYLRELIVGFHAMYGDKLTIASAALSMLRSYHGFEQFKSDTLDDRFRRYYYGGRNQCFETGVLRPRSTDNFLLIDRNSMYPAEMRDTLHPISNRAELQREIDDDTDFAYIEAINHGALPTRADNGSLDFTVKRGSFYATIHEIRAGLDTGTLEIIQVKHAWKFDMKASFAEFVDRFYGYRLDAKAEGDLVKDILYKFGLNSPYGKFALNPRKFRQWMMTVGEIPTPLCSAKDPEGWTLHSQSGDLFIWSRPTPRKGGFYNVATAASITGAARANLLRNLALSERPLYCDTDSIICETFAGELNETGLGGWKLEATGNLCAIAGKKLYTLIDDKSAKWTDHGEAVKRASKGVRLEPHEIISVCNGSEIVFQNPVPNFKLDGSAQFISRTIRRTGTHDR